MSESRDFWADFIDSERDEEVEHVRAQELAHRERLDEKGLPHAFKCYDPESAWVEDTKRSLGLTPRRPDWRSQSAAILRILEDGQWHSVKQLHSFAPRSVGERIIELQRRGYDIEGGNDGFRLRSVGERS